MTRDVLIWGLAALAFVLLAACSAPRPEAKLLGKWEADVTATKSPHQLTEPVTGIQFEFFADGSVAVNKKRGNGQWQQAGIGAFKFVDPSHVKTDFPWYSEAGEGAIYEVIWNDSDHLEFRTPDGRLPLTRVR